jgi:hypothetical protein
MQSFDLIDSAKRASGREPRLGIRHARGYVLVSQRVEVFLDFFSETGFPTTPKYHVEPARQEDPKSSSAHDITC